MTARANAYRHGRACSSMRSAMNLIMNTQSSTSFSEAACTIEKDTTSVPTPPPDTHTHTHTHTQTQTHTHTHTHTDTHISTNTAPARACSSSTKNTHKNAGSKQTSLGTALNHAANRRETALTAACSRRASNRRCGSASNLSAAHTVMHSHIAAAAARVEPERHAPHVLGRPVVAEADAELRDATHPPAPIRLCIPASPPPIRLCIPAPPPPPHP